MAKQESAFSTSGAERWCLDYGVRRSPQGRWRALGVDLAANWFAFHRDGAYPDPATLPRRDFALDATSEEAAMKEALALNKKFDKAFFKARDEAGVPFKREEKFDAWDNAHGRLIASLKELAKFKVRTSAGLYAKIVALSAGLKAFDEDWYGDEIKASIFADAKRLAGSAGSSTIGPRSLT